MSLRHLGLLGLGRLRELLEALLSGGLFGRGFLGIAGRERLLGGAGVSLGFGAGERIGGGVERLGLLGQFLLSLAGRVHLRLLLSLVGETVDQRLGLLEKLALFFGELAGGLGGRCQRFLLRILGGLRELSGLLLPLGLRLLALRLSELIGELAERFRGGLLLRGVLIEGRFQLGRRLGRIGRLIALGVCEFLL